MSSGRVPRAGLVGVLLVTAVLYGRSLNGPFVYDDLLHIAGNPALRTPGNLHGVLYSGYQGTRPLYNLSLAATAAIAGVAPFPFHLVSLLLHLSVGVLVYALGRRLGGGTYGSLFGTALFLLHPIHTESVAYVNSRSGLLMSLFALSALLLVSREEPLKPTTKIAVGVLSLLAAASKESAAVLPALAFLLTRSWQRSLLLLPATVLVPFLFLLFPTPHSGTVGSAVPNALGHVRAEPYALVRLLQMLLVPVGQSIDHEVPLPSSWVAPSFLGWLAVLLCIVGVAVWGARKNALVGVAALWFFLAIAPTNSIVPFVDTLAERHVYLASVGPLLVVGLLLEQYAQQFVHHARMLWTLGLSFLAMQTVALFLRQNVWRDEAALWADAIEKGPTKARPHLNYGSALVDRGQMEAALAEFRRARQLDPALAEATYNEGLALLRLRRYAEAVEPLEDACRRRAWKRRWRLDLAMALHYTGQTERALLLLDEIIASGAPEARAASQRRLLIERSRGALH